VDNKSYNIRVPRRWARIAMIVGVTALIVAPLTAVATHSFDDVPNDNTFHDDIAWLKDAAVTLGCNPPDNDQYCPDDNVTREQMAAFMRRLAENQVVDAGTLDGTEASDLMSAAHVATTEDIIAVPTSSTVDVMTLTLAPGSYLIQARASVNQNSGVAGRNITCTLSAGSTSQTNQNFWTEPNGGIDTLDVSFMIVNTFDATGDAVLSCTGGANWNGNVLDPTISAVSVNDISVNVTSASGAGDPNE
jgi:hypothetical protein